ncbi:MAG TPA: hypothetical protein PLL06_06085 [Acidobacteriota bacterium]|nr:hypothetical protein [Acidobacteriota bacterium]HNB73534.1 hypothetical protein [Acidobacteriota bacterium]
MAQKCIQLISYLLLPFQVALVIGVGVIRALLPAKETKFRVSTQPASAKA